ncbi:sphingosine N-acyltransferase lag1, partial [Marasmius crinis-equi]
LAFKILVVPIAGYLNWELLTPFLGLSSEQLPNPFAPFFLLSNPVSSSTPSDPRYAKSWGELAFIGYHIVFFSLVRQFVTITTCHPIVRYFGIRSEAKLARFGEQDMPWCILQSWGPGATGSCPNFRRFGTAQSTGDDTFSGDKWATTVSRYYKIVKNAKWAKWRAFYDSAKEFLPHVPDAPAPENDSDSDGLDHVMLSSEA